MTGKLSFREYVEAIKTLETVINESVVKSVVNNDWYFEDFCDAVIERGLDLESVMTGDIAGITEPIGMLRRKQPYESAPPGDKAERFILKNKEPFKKRYGDDYKQILYATAWKLHKSKW